ncbi:Rhomboid-like protein [Aphelenchoides bicaudatus]|nr:Rhomboid-like protein [Aphelenchoides bicaudatus]
MTAKIPQRLSVDDSEGKQDWHSYFRSLESNNEGFVHKNDIHNSIRQSVESYEMADIGEPRELEEGEWVQASEQPEKKAPAPPSRAITKQGITPPPPVMNLARMKAGRDIFPIARQLNLSDKEAEVVLNDVRKSKDEYWDFPQFCNSMAKAKKMNLTRSLFYAAKPPLFMISASTYTSRCKLTVNYLPNGPTPLNSVLIFNPYKKSQIWRFLTYMFIHVGYSHLIGNIIVQLILGLPLELVHKLWRVSLLYFLGVITGCVLMVVFNQNTYLGGSSAGAYALLSAHVSNLVLNWDEVEVNYIQAAALGIFICSDVGLALYQTYGSDELNSVSYVSHLGGFIAGLLLGIVLLRNLKWKNWEFVAQKICLAVYIVFMTVCIALIFLLPVFSKSAIN